MRAIWTVAVVVLVPFWETVAVGSGLLDPKGKLLFEETFDNLDAWRHEGGGVMKLDVKEPGTLRLECVGSGQGKTGAMAFCLRDFPDGIALEYDLKVLTRNGLVITFVATRGSRGEDMFDPSQPKRKGVFADYVRNKRLVSYHVSVSRYDDKGKHTGQSNWRRNPGLHMMKSGPDLCREIKRWYRIRIVKDGGHCQLGVDGKLAHEFRDPGTLKTPLPTAGKIGFRAIGSEVRARIRNLRVIALRPEGETPADPADAAKPARRDVPPLRSLIAEAGNAEDEKVCYETLRRMAKRPDAMPEMKADLDPPLFPSGWWATGVARPLTRDFPLRMLAYYGERRRCAEGGDHRRDRPKAQRASSGNDGGPRTGLLPQARNRTFAADMRGSGD